VATAPSSTPARSADPRRVALTVIRRVAEDGAYADRALHADAAALDARDRALAKRLAFGAIQMRGALDWVIDEHISRALDPPVRAALQLGLYQLLFTEIADHAAVGETVELVKPHPASKLVNAVLRAVQRDGVTWPDDVTPAGAAIQHSHPLWLVEMWWQWLGADEARALLAANNLAPERALRVNTLVATEVDLAGTRDGDALVVRDAIDLFRHPLYLDGAVTPQSRASQAVAIEVDPQPGERILDLCAAPGGKTTHLAALSQDCAEIVAVEAHQRRARTIEAQAHRLKAGSIRVVVGDAMDLAAIAAQLGGQFDRVLLDPPCTGLGTLQRHPDLRWRVSPDDPSRLALIQQQMLQQARSVLRPGGRLVYSVCTLSAAEELPMTHQRRFTPHADGTDGFYIGRDD
jgi:16S rRNA (cytosine967-C5)-methyltransferase